MNFVDIQYLSLLSNKLERYKVKHTNPYKINFRCPFCLDSQKSKQKARGWMLETQNKFYYYCHNCGIQKSFNSFLKEIDGTLYKEYITEKYLEKIKDTKKEIINKEDKPVTYPKLSSLKNVNDLDKIHPVIAYLEKRKIPKETYDRIYYSPKFMTWVNSLIPNKFPNITKDHPRLILPFIDENDNCFGVSARAFDTKNIRYINIMFNESKQKIFGMDKVNTNYKYLILEGAIDSLFLNNAIAMAGADGNYKNLPNINNGVFVFDNEPRNKEIVKKIEKLINAGMNVCIWPIDIKGKDINEMILNNYTSLEIEKIIKENTLKGLKALAALHNYKRI